MRNLFKSFYGWIGGLLGLGISSFVNGGVLQPDGLTGYFQLQKVSIIVVIVFFVIGFLIGCIIDSYLTKKEEVKNG